MRDKKKITIIGSIVFLVLAVAMIFGISLGYYFFGYQGEDQIIAASPPINSTTSPQVSPTPSDDGGIPIFSDIFGLDSTGTTAAPNGVGIIEIIVRLFLAVILAGILAFRPRRNVPFFQRNLSVAQTQILLAVVAAGLMMIVGNNVARAFAIFAAATLVRFRTNIRDPKEITVLLISLALGMAAGVGRWELGSALCLFTLVLLWFLEQQEPEQVFRSMELSVKSRDTDKTQNVLKKIFKRYKLIAEVRELDPPDEKDAIGSITYYLDLPLNISTDSLSDRIFTFDSKNIEGVTWKHKKKAKFIG